jgi:hypothetical protein
VRAKFIKEELNFTGEQFASLFAYDNFNILGDSIIAFIGTCDVSIKEIVDLELAKSGKKTFYCPKMLHFLAEHFEVDMEKAILRSLLLLNIIKDYLNETLKQTVIKRVGTELFADDSRIGFSLASSSPVSSLIYVGVAIFPAEGGKGLESYGIDPQGFANEVMERYIKETERITQLRCRTRWVE